MDINEIDKKIIWQIARRLSVVEKIGEIKKKNKSKTVDNTRELEVLNLINNAARDLGVNQKFIEKIFKLIIKESKRIQNET